MPKARIWLPAALAWITACGQKLTGPPTPPPPAGIRFVSGSSIADTIGAQLATPVVVEIRRANGDLASGVSVVFDGISVSGFVYFFVTPDGSFSNARVADTTITDGQGRAQAWLYLNTVAQLAYLNVGVPSLGLRDSLGVTIKPGALARIAFAPADTGLLIDGTYLLSTIGRDRAANPVAASVTFSVDSGPVSIAPTGMVTGNAVGRAVLKATAGPIVARAHVSVVPTATFVAVEYNSNSPSGDGSRLVSVRSDGAQFQVLATISGSWLSGPPQFGAWPSWLTSTNEVLFIGDQGLRALRNDGTTRTIFEGDPPVFNYFSPQVSADGQWIFFTRGRWGFGATLWKIHPDGSGLTSIEDSGVFAGFQGGPAPDPTGSYLVYQTHTWFDGSLRKLDLATLQSVPLVVRGSWASWSPDGSQIVFMDDDSSIRTIRPDGTEGRVVIDRSWVNPGFSWSPDAKYLVAMEYGPTYPTPVIIDAATLERMPLPYSIHGSRVLFQLSWKP